MSESEIDTNPFRLPSDEEVFLLREQEKRTKAEEKEKFQSQRIWEKGVDQTHIGRIRKLHEEIQPTELSKSTKKNLLATSSVAREHHREKENLTDFISKKREMFLVQMSLDTKREEIRKLEEKAVMKEEALKQSEQMLEEDMMRFDSFLKENDRRAHEAIRKAEAETKAKQEKVAKIKLLNQQIAQVQSEMTKHKEQLEECLKYKEFLDKLTPKEWLEEQQTLRKVRREKRKQDWIQKRLEEMHEREELETPNPDKNSGNKSGDESTGQPKKKKGVKKTVIQKLEQEYREAESDEEIVMYFKHPQQLLDIFTHLEEQNLFLIQNSQEAEQNLEELKQSFEETKRKMEEKTRSLKDNISELQKQIEDEQDKSNSLAAKINDNKAVRDQSAILDDLSKKITQVYVACGFENSQTTAAITKLQHLENRLEELLSAIEDMDPTYVMKAEKEKEKERRQKVRNEKLELQKKQYEERLKKSLQRAQEPPKKKTGKPVMFRSAPFKKKKTENDEDKKRNDEEEDFKRFFS
eukprot:GILI01004701.1.p1 GENE.GILI01004701.1~~GILI01004701.1.p1  ORF type:complete len:523 (-),score=155.30 GILI01004701.1:36-1604(-)